MKRSPLAGLVAAGLLTAGACATRPVAPAPSTIAVPVAAPCAAEPPPAPDYPDTDAALKAAPDLFARVRLLVAGRLMRIAHERELQAALTGCVAKPALADPAIP